MINIESYIYIHIHITLMSMVQIMNKGLPLAAYLVIADFLNDNYTAEIGTVLFNFLEQNVTDYKIKKHLEKVHRYLV